MQGRETNVEILQLRNLVSGLQQGVAQGACRDQTGETAMGVPSALSQGTLLPEGAEHPPRGLALLPPVGTGVLSSAAVSATESHDTGGRANAVGADATSPRRVETTVSGAQQRGRRGGTTVGRKVAASESQGPGVASGQGGGDAGRPARTPRRQCSEAFKEGGQGTRAHHVPASAVCTACHNVACTHSGACCVFVGSPRVGGAGRSGVS